MSVTEDPTLRPGDIVVTSAGVRIFQGDRTVPHSEREFVDYRSAREASGAVRAYLDVVDQPYRARAAAKATETSSTAGEAGRARASAPAAKAKRWMPDPEPSPPAGRQRRQ